MEEKIKSVFNNMREHSVQCGFITFSQFEELLGYCEKIGYEKFYYSSILQNFYLESSSDCVKYFDEREFLYDDGVNCLNEPSPEIFDGITFHFLPEFAVKRKTAKKKETKQVTF